MTNGVQHSAPLGLELRALVLDECHVKRGQGGSDTPGKVESSFDIEASQVDDGGILYRIASTHSLTTFTDESLAEIEVTFVAIYDTDGNAQPSEDQIGEFGRQSVMFHVVPFVREFLATMTNRLAIPPFYLPIFTPSSDAVEGAEVAAEDANATQ